MKNFRVKLERTQIDSVWLDVKAENEDHAVRVAEKMVQQASDKGQTLDWEPEDESFEVQDIEVCDEEGFDGEEFLY